MNLSHPWMIEAARHVGLREVPGKATAPAIRRWLIKLRAWWSDDETPWCGVFAGECCRVAGLSLPAHWYRAKAWLEWGTPLVSPVYGCVVVFERKGGGHVGFVVGQDRMGRLMVLGGNQNNAVSIAPFERTRVAGYRWPPGQPFQMAALPVLDSAAPTSTNEA